MTPGVRSLETPIVRIPAPAAYLLPGLGLGTILFIAGMVWKPPFGGLILLAASAVAAAGAFLLLLRPGLFLGFFLLYATFAPFFARIVHLPLGWFKGIFFLAILPIWLLTRAADRSPHWRGARVPLAVYGGAAAIFGMLAAVTATRGVPALQIVNATIGYLLYPLLIFIAYDAAGGMTRVPRFLWWVFGLCCAVALGAVIQSFVPVETLLRFGLSLETGMVAFVAVDPISGKLYQRLFSFLDDQSSVAALSFLGIALSLHLLGAASSRGKRAIVVLGLALLGYALLLTYNMTMISAVFLFVLILVVRQRSGKLLLWFLIVTLLVAGIGWIRFGDLIRNRVMTSFTLQKGVSTSLVFRLEENRRGWKLLWDEPVIGRGIGSTANLLVYYKLGMRSSAEGGIPTDNFYLTTALEAGWIGWLALFSVHLLPLIALGRLARSRDPDERRFGVIAGSAVAVLLIANLSNGPMNTNPSNLLFWMLTGFAWRRLYEREVEEGSRAALPVGTPLPAGAAQPAGEPLPSGAPLPARSALAAPEGGRP